MLRLPNCTSWMENPRQLVGRVNSCQVVKYMIRDGVRFKGILHMYNTHRNWAASLIGNSGT